MITTTRREDLGDLLSSHLLRAACLAAQNSPAFGKRFGAPQGLGEGACDRLTTQYPFFSGLIAAEYLLIGCLAPLRRCSRS
jgi:hypothetical protein